MRRAKFLFFSLALTLTTGPRNLNAQRTPSLSVYMTGKVTTGSSNPAPSVWVILYDGTRATGRALTGDDGRYYIGNLQNKTYTIVVRRTATASNLISQEVTLPKNRVFNIKLP